MGGGDNHGGRREISERAEQHQRCGDWNHLGDGHPVDPVHEVDQIDEPQAGQKQNRSLDPQRTGRNDPKLARYRIENRADRQPLQDQPWYHRNGFDVVGGATIGFAPFNRPVARIFLGDVGSLPTGLLLGWCLLELISRQQLTAAVLLPLYYLADATVTLLRRLAKHERVWAAHRSHFYQRATDNGFSVLRVVGEVFALNLALAALAIASTMTASLTGRIALLLTGCFAVALVLIRFSRPR